MVSSQLLKPGTAGAIASAGMNAIGVSNER